MIRATIYTAALAAISTAAHAEPELELGAAFGGHEFSHTSELGAYDDDLDPGPNSSGMLGARVGVGFATRFAAEAEVMVIPTDDDVLHRNAMVYDVRGQLRFDLLTGRVRPFVLAGVGMQVLRSSSMQLINDTDPELHWGVGVRYAVNEHFDLRVDGRQLIVPDRSYNGATADYEATFGVSYRFGKAPPPPAPVMEPLPPPPAPEPVVEAPPPPPPPPAPVIEELAGIGFERDSAVIDTVSEPILEAAYKLLHDHDDLSVEISGHTSSEGDPARNEQLSLARAQAVKAYLVHRGVAAERISAVGKGSGDPIADNASEDGRVKNRRIEFRVVTPEH
ncbi:MAG TPA: OmpA family protein [Kofleriaceae bacterium]|jgi:OOP family OmpA-OmpF porin|nr:OmpA family protein [Kofleriaceae bacterium]